VHQYPLVFFYPRTSALGMAMQTTRPRQPVVFFTPPRSRQAFRMSAPSVPPRRSSMAALKNDNRSQQHESQPPSSRYSSFTKSSGLPAISDSSNIASASRSSNLTNSLDSLSIESARSRTRSPIGPSSREPKTSMIGGLKALRRTLSPNLHPTLQSLSPTAGKGFYSFPRRSKQRLSGVLPRLLRRKRPLRILPPWSKLRQWRLRTKNLKFPKQECPICTEQQSILHYPQRPITAACAHEANICLGCVSQSITAQMETLMWDQLACPLCAALLTFADMKMWAKGKDFER